MKKVLFIYLVLILIIPANAQQQIRKTSANLNFRSGPYIGDNIIKVIPKGTTLAVDYTVQKNDDWIKIEYKGKSGFVYAKYLVNPWQINSYSYNGNCNTNTRVKYYINSRGEKVQSPTYYNSPPANATAICRDGTYSFSRSRRGTCSHHGGVKQWL